MNDQKQIFALEYIKNGKTNPIAAAMKIESDFQQAVMLAKKFVKDADVLRIIENTENDGNIKSLLPSKDEFAIEIYNMGKNCDYPDVCLKFMKLYADLRGFTKDSINVDQSVHQQNVLVVSSFGNDEEWEQRLKKQQQNLINGQI